MRLRARASFSSGSSQAAGVSCVEPGARETSPDCSCLKKDTCGSHAVHTGTWRILEDLIILNFKKKIERFHHLFFFKQCFFLTFPKEKRYQAAAELTEHPPLYRLIEKVGERLCTHAWAYLCYVCLRVRACVCGCWVFFFSSSSSPCFLSEA